MAFTLNYKPGKDLRDPKTPKKDRARPPVLQNQRARPDRWKP